MKYFLSFVLMLFLFQITKAESVSAQTTKTIYRCKGSDSYGDVDWKVAVRLYSDYALISYKANNEEPLRSKVKIVDSRLELPSPDGNVKIELLLNSPKISWQYSDRYTGEKIDLDLAFDYFYCR